MDSPSPDTSALESLDDLINRQRSTSGPQEHPDESSTLLADDSQSSSSVTVIPDSPGRAHRPRDEARWNGFHLWRTESYNIRAARERAAAEARRLADRQGWAREIGKSVQGWYRRGCEAVMGSGGESESDRGKGMSRGKMLLLTLVMAGAQLAWCLEFGYGTPYLLSLGVSKASTSLVWLAAPMSGLIMQPLVGVLSDLSSSAFRRRQFILYSLLSLVISTLVLGFSTPIASALVDILHTGLADWDPARKRALDAINRFIAVVAFVFLDLSINSLQAAARALILDTAPPSQHSRANAWHGRMTHVGNVAGYAAGWYDLSSTSLLTWLGGGQFRKYAVVSVVGVVTCSLITCYAIQEERRESGEGVSSSGVGSKLKEAVYHIYQSIRRLPRPVRRICLVQLFAFMGWFPFLFYATEWIIEIRQREKGQKGGSHNVDDEAAEKGSFALLMFALVSLLAGVLLPYLSLSNSSKARSVHLPGAEDQLVPDEDRGNGEDSKPAKRSWRLTLRTIWTISLVLYSLQATVLTFAVQTTLQATVLLASIGIPWAVASWVPFALVMESVREAEDGTSPFEFEADWFAPERVRGRRESSSAFAARAAVSRALRDCEPLSASSDRPSSTFLARGTEVVGDSTQSPSRQGSLGAVSSPVQNTSQGGGGVESLGGTVLGIHNLAIVLPQLIVALLAAFILRKGPAAQSHSGRGQDDDGVSVVWVIRTGGLAALCAALFTRFVPLTRTERLFRGDGILEHEPRFDDEASEGEGEER